jgi:ABC-type phosphate/phosphonate transport system substrate-binding protein
MKRLGTAITRRQCIAGLTAMWAAALAPERSLGSGEQHPLRLAVSVETLAGANVDDARAAFRVWLREIASVSGIKTAEAVPEVFLNSEELINEIRNGLLDSYGIVATELAQVYDVTEQNTIVLQDYLADGIEYVMLVHSGSPYRKISDLRGAQLVTHLHRDMVLLPAWLGTVLAANGLAMPEYFFGSHKHSDNINQVLLPVFFKRVDAACVARRNWEAAIELNPQLGRDLRPLLVSPRLIPIGFFFRKNTSAESRNALIQSIQAVASLTAGRQIMDIYQSQGFAARTMASMKPTLEMVRQFERLSGQQAGMRKGPG